MSKGGKITEVDYGIFFMDSRVSGPMNLRGVYFVVADGLTLIETGGGLTIPYAEEFIAAITQHIPEKSFQMVRYYGWYSNRARGERRKAAQPATTLDQAVPEEIEVLDVSSYQPSGNSE